jgi:hypothetical protein
MNYIFCFLFLMGISGTQGREVGCPKTALDCASICACWKEGKEPNTLQTQLLNGECHMCKPTKGANPPLMFAPRTNSKEDTEILESDEDN